MGRKAVEGKTGKTSDYKRALYRNQVTDLLDYEKIVTTETKAKVLKPRVEKMITRAKVDNLHNRRELLKVLPTRNAVKKLFEVLGPKYKERKGGYLRITKLDPRKGDGAKMAMIEFV